MVQSVKRPLHLGGVFLVLFFASAALGAQEETSEPVLTAPAPSAALVRPEPSARAAELAQEMQAVVNTAASASDAPFWRIRPRAEFGYVSILHHLYRVGSIADGNTTFDFVKQGGQEILFPYARYSLDLDLWDNQIVTFLYQPLTVQTKTVVGKNGTGPVRVDGVLFPTGTPLDLQYGFDFWRASWMWDFNPSAETVWGAGLSLQFRNASVIFESAEGSAFTRTVSQNLGPVPILKGRYAQWFGPHWGFEAELDTIYAGIPVINGAEFNFAGWIWDLGLTLKSRFVPGSTAFLLLRTLGGGAEGTTRPPSVATVSSSRENFNSLATFVVALGFSLE